MRVKNQVSMPLSDGQKYGYLSSSHIRQRKCGDIFTSALKAHMHKPDEDSEYNKERTEASTYAAGVRYVQRSDTVNKYMHE